jgi:hypothetical protein
MNKVLDFFFLNPKPKSCYNILTAYRLMILIIESSYGSLSIFESFGEKITEIMTNTYLQAYLIDNLLIFL